MHSQGFEVRVRNTRMSVCAMCRRMIAVLTVLTFAASGCTKAIDVPREQFESASQDASAPHKIRMHDGAEYVAAQFSLTDSTLVIGRLSQSDYLYKSRQVPIILPRSAVESIARVESSKVVPVVMILSAAALMIGLSAWFHGWGGY